MAANGPVWSSVPAEPWTEPAILVATGPSLDLIDPRELRGLGRVVAVKEAWRAVDGFYDAVVSADVNWVRRPGAVHYLEKIAAEGKLWLAYPRPQWSVSQAVIHGAKYLDRVSSVEPGFAEDKSQLKMGYSSGFAALNFVYHRRPPQIFMFGFDYGEVRGPDKRVTKHHAGDVNGWYKPGSSDWRSWARHYASAVCQLSAAKIEVINCCLDSQIEAFQKVRPDVGIDRLRGLRSEAA